MIQTKLKKQFFSLEFDFILIAKSIKFKGNDSITVLGETKNE